MKDAITISIIILTILIIFTIFVNIEIATSEVYADDSRFETIYSTNTYKIVYDKTTKVQYVMSTGTYNMGNVTSLVTPEGKPLLCED